MVQIKDIPFGTMIGFRTKNAGDTIVWQGTLESTGRYQSIRRFSNPASYNEAVRQTDPTVPSDLTELTYFLITVDNNATSPTEEVFAQEWIVDGSLQLIYLGSRVTIQIEDHANNPQTILSLLAGAGYPCKVIPNR